MKDQMNDTTANDPMKDQMNDTTLAVRVFHQVIGIQGLLSGHWQSGSFVGSLAVRVFHRVIGSWGLLSGHWQSGHSGGNSRNTRLSG